MVPASVRFGLVIAFAACCLAVEVIRVRADRPLRPTSAGRAAENWFREAGPDFRLSLSGGQAGTIAFTTNTKVADEARPGGAVFPISQEAAADLLQTLIDSGLWGRTDQVPLGLVGGRTMTLGPAVVHDNVYTGYHFWVLGADADDLSTMFIMRRLREVTSGPQRAALDRWLKAGTKADGK